MEDGTMFQPRLAWLCIGLSLAVIAAVPLRGAPPTVPPNVPQPQRVYPPPQSPDAGKPRAGEGARRRAEPTNTTLQIDLFASDPTQALQSQNWGRVFDSLGHRIRIRTG